MMFNFGKRFCLDCWPTTQTRAFTKTIIVFSIVALIFMLFKFDEHIVSVLTIITSKVSESTITISTQNLIGNGSQNNFLVSTSNCKIPDLDPFDPSLKGVVGRGVIVKCNKMKVYTYENADTIFVNISKMKNDGIYESFSHCTVRPITRPFSERTDHNSFAELKPIYKFNISIQPGYEYVHSLCYNKNDNLLFENYHSLILTKNETEKRCNERFSKRRESKPDMVDSPSVLVIVVDSVSRVNSIRFMPKTRSYLKNHLRAFEMKGFTKVGYGTFHNMVPVTTGKFYRELPWSFETPQQFDKYDFIWKNYSQQGYRTYLAEDYPSGAFLDYKKPGFHKQPTDYFNRHLFLAMYNNPKAIYNEENCILDRQQTAFVLDPALQFMSKFRDNPYLCMLLLTRLTHDWLERTASADAFYYNFMKKAFEDGSLDNTFVFLMADHGMRFGSIRKWYIGLMEERLPMMFMYVPEKFRKKYPESIRNLEINTERLTTMFDLHETMKHLLNFNGEEKDRRRSNDRSYSFFDHIPEERGCAEAGVPKHWCTCSSIENADINSSIVVNSAKHFVDGINALLKNVKHLCEILEVDKVDTAYRIKPSSTDLDKVLISHKITFTAKPGGGLFEGTVTYDKKQNIYKLSKDIGRINEYGKEKHCNVDYSQERLCYCKSNMRSKL